MLTYSQIKPEARPWERISRTQLEQWLDAAGEDYDDSDATITLASLVWSEWQSVYPVEVPDWVDPDRNKALDTHDLPPGLVWKHDTSQEGYFGGPKVWIVDDPEAFYQWLEDLCYGGCASGAYMPAVTYWQALRTMAEHGNAVLDYIDGRTAGVMTLELNTGSESWAGFACRVLSFAVESWAGETLNARGDL